MFALTLDFHGVVLRVISDSPEQIKWLEARHSLFIVPHTVDPAAEISWTEASVVSALAQYGLFFMHAAAFKNKAGRGILATGPAGSGKSTLAYSALSCGYPYVCDDVALCRWDGQGIRVLPFTNQIGINGGLADKMFYDVLEHHTKEVFCQIKPDVVVLPHIISGRASCLKKLTGRKTPFHALIRNIIWVDDKEMRRQQVCLLNELSGLPTYALMLGKDHKRRPQVAVDLLNGI